MAIPGRVGARWRADPVPGRPPRSVRYRARFDDRTAAAGAHRQPWDDAQHFDGRIAGFTVGDIALDAARVAALARTPPDASTRCEPASPQWPVQTRQVVGQVTPPATLPA